MNKVMKVFPNITTLGLNGTHVNNDFLRSVIKNLPGLTGLTINHCTTDKLLVNDEGITGIPMNTEICEKLKLPASERDKFDFNAVKIYPGIGDLQRKFHMKNATNL